MANKPGSIRAEGDFDATPGWFKGIRAAGSVIALPFRALAFLAEHWRGTGVVLALGSLAFVGTKVYHGVEDWQAHHAKSAPPAATAPQKPHPITTTSTTAPKPAAKPAPAGAASINELFKRELGVAQNGGTTGMDTSGFTIQRLSGSDAVNLEARIVRDVGVSGSMTQQGAALICAAWGANPGIAGSGSSEITTDFINAQKDHVNVDGQTLYPAAFYIRASRACQQAVDNYAPAHQITFLSVPPS